MFDPVVNAVIDQVDALRTQVNDHWQVPRDEAQFLAQLVRLGECRSLLEIGTSYGFSGLHLAAAAQRHGGRLHTVDINPNKTAAARTHLSAAGLLEHVTLHTGDARELVTTITPAEPFDFVFIDATKEQSFAYLAALWPKLAARAVLVTDNTTSHEAELRDFVEHLRGLPDTTSCHVAIGNGVELTIRG